MKKSILLTILISQLMISCDKKKDIIFSKTEKIIDDSSTISTINNNQTNTKSAKTTLDWVGTYEGILPCSNCAGIKTTVTLNKDESIKITSQYFKQNKKIENEGNIKWTADNNALYLDTKDKNRFFYKVEENKLIVLTQEGEEMKSALSNKYILNKK
ncbi:MAG: copper resistance protein NlpE [Empedobacter falsenii]